MSDDGFPDGLCCPTCGSELDREAVSTDTAILVIFLCTEHGAIGMASPFE